MPMATGALAEQMCLGRTMVYGGPWSSHTNHTGNPYNGYLTPYQSIDDQTPIWGTTIHYIHRYRNLVFFWTSRTISALPAATCRFLGSVLVPLQMASMATKSKDATGETRITSKPSEANNLRYSSAVDHTSRAVDGLENMLPQKGIYG